MPVAAVREESARTGVVAHVEGDALSGEQVAGRATPSEFGECGCPHDCDRDHENE